MVTENKLEKIKNLAKKRIKNLIVVLEDVKDKFNAGAILRTCDALGVPFVYFIFNKIEFYDPYELTSTSVGSSKWILYKIFSKDNYENPTIECIESLKKENFKIVATVVNEKVENIFEFNWPEKTALFLGNEVNGLSDYAIKNADYKVYIPMLGMVESLNVSVSAGIFIYDIILKRKIKNQVEFLDEKEQENYLKEILKKLKYNFK